MPRVKKSVRTHKRHQRMIDLAKGYRAGKHSMFALAQESVMHALYYAYCHRRERKGDMRRLWITRVNAASRLNGLTYGQLMDGLRKSGVALDRKALADIAVREPAAFAELASTAKAQLKG